MSDTAYIIISNGQFTIIDDLLEVQLCSDHQTWTEIVSSTIDAYVKLKIGLDLYGLSDDDTSIFNGLQRSLTVILDPNCNDLYDQVQRRIADLTAQIKESSVPPRITIGDVTGGSALPLNSNPDIVIVRSD